MRIICQYTAIKFYKLYSCYYAFYEENDLQGPFINPYNISDVKLPLPYYPAITET